jgi:hypothetical protein
MACYGSTFNIQTFGNPATCFGCLQVGIEQIKYINGQLRHGCTVVELKYKY